jgi:hypothetical protein
MEGTSSGSLNLTDPLVYPLSVWCSRKLCNKLFFIKQSQGEETCTACGTRES